MARLSTHVLDTSRGLPAAGVAIDLYTGDRQHVVALVTNTDGRAAAQEVGIGTYELVFHAGDYLRIEPPFFDLITIRFRVSNAEANYHVPLLLSPFGYSTYRGS